MKHDYQRKKALAYEWAMDEKPKNRKTKRYLRRSAKGHYTRALAQEMKSYNQDKGMEEWK